MHFNRDFIIGDRGYIANELKKRPTLISKFQFLPSNAIDLIPLGFGGHVVVTSFPRKWFSTEKYDYHIEKQILERVNPNYCKITYLSSSKVYPNGLDINESHKLKPQSIYAKNKALAEEFIQNNFSYYRILRATNFFSKSGGSFNSFFFHIKRNLRESNSFIFDVSLDSERDFINVDYLGKFLESNDFFGGIFNFSSGIRIAISEIVNLIICNSSFSNSEIKIVRSNEIKSQILCNKKLLSTYNMGHITKSQILNDISSIKF